MSADDSGVDAGSDSDASESMSVGSEEHNIDEDAIVQVNQHHHLQQLLAHAAHHQACANENGQDSEPKQGTSSQIDFNFDSSQSFLNFLSVPSDYVFEDIVQHEYSPKIKTGQLKKNDTRLEPIARDFTMEKKLRLAANLGDANMVESLLEDGVNARACDSRKRTALHFAAAKGDTKIAQLLLEHGADPNQRDTIGNTALHLAACTNNIAMVTLLLKSGTDVNILDNSGRTPLHLAQSKLKHLQQSDSTVNSEQLKNEVLHVAEMMTVYLQRSGKSAEVDQLTTFTSRLHLHQTKEEFSGDVQELLSSLEHLSLQSIL